ncbi:hypothetical protein J6TS7_13150 [Paenibacillus dendritiformis]|nr:hypothetical protein J6TS7_13150 [Paenibacillus dendritiformis]
MRNFITIVRRASNRPGMTPAEGIAFGFCHEGTYTEIRDRERCSFPIQSVHWYHPMKGAADWCHFFRTNRSRELPDLLY